MSQIDDSERCTGRTIRLVDYYIQKLYETGYVVVKDHVDKPICHKECARRVMKRLKNEHRITVIYNHTNNTITKLDR